MHKCVANGHVVFSCGNNRNFSKHAIRAQRQQLRTVSAAALEEPQTAESDSEWNKEEAYRKFESLLDQHSVSFTAGDKVCGRFLTVARSGIFLIVHQSFTYLSLTL